MNKLSKVTMVLAVGLLVLSGCSKSPDKEIRQATNAITACESEGRVDEMYKAAQGFFAAANADKLEQDTKFALFRSYGRCRENYLKAVEAANKATRPTYAYQQQQQQTTQNWGTAPSMNTSSIEAQLRVVEMKLDMILMELKSGRR
jgi:uncharacterized protein YceK